VSWHKECQQGTHFVYRSRVLNVQVEHEGGEQVLLGIHLPKIALTNYKLERKKLEEKGEVARSNLCNVRC
jgi:hypothetical protein